MFVKLTNGQPDQLPYTFGQLRRDNPLTSFPKDIPVETLSLYGVYPVEEVKPDFDSKRQFLQRNEAPHKDGDKWLIGFIIHDIPAETFATSVRNRRNKLLTETDWMALSDVAMTAEMTTYRQALRDVTQQSGFPNTVVWPVKP